MECLAITAEFNNKEQDLSEAAMLWFKALERGSKLAAYRAPIDGEQVHLRRGVAWKSEYKTLYESGAWEIDAEAKGRLCLAFVSGLFGNCSKEQAVAYVQRTFAESKPSFVCRSLRPPEYTTTMRFVN